MRLRVSRPGPLAWLTLAAVCLGYLALYTSIITSSAKEPTSAGTVLRFWHQLVGYTLVPGLFGGPWQWLPSADLAPLVATEVVPRVLAWAARSYPPGHLELDDDSPVPPPVSADAVTARRAPPFSWRGRCSARSRRCQVAGQ